MSGDDANSPESLSLALRALDRKERTVAEMGSWLRARGVAEQDSAEVIDRLISTGDLDDIRYARRYAEDKRTLKKWGRVRIRVALLDRGISAGDAEEAVADEAGEAEIERAVEVLRTQGLNLVDALERQRGLGMLVRRGYESEDAYEAIRRVRPG